MNFKQFLVATILVLAIVPVLGNLTGQEAPAGWNQEKTNQLDELLQSLAKKKQFNGAILLAEGGKVVFEKYLGVSNANDQTPLSPNSSFRLASVSKQFTAMAIMILKEQGKLDYDDDIRKFLPRLPYDGVTIRHLLNHTSGLPDYERWFRKNWDRESANDQKKMAFNKDVVEQFSKHKPEIVFKPGEKWEYSNTGYVVLGHIIEQASEIPVRDFLQQNIFDPLEMKNTQAFVPTQAFSVSERVYGFRVLEDGENHVDNDWDFLNGMIGDGGVYASARDLLKWDRALANHALVNSETLEEAFESGKTNQGRPTGYGFGWMVVYEDEKLVNVHHAGGWVGFVTYIQRDIEKDRTLIVLTNHSSRHFGRVLSGLRNIWD